MINNSDLILVAGATGGVGQLVVAKLLDKNLSVRVLTRNKSQAEQMFDDQVDIGVGDIRYPNTLTSVTQDVTHIICCTGTTAFPSKRWDFVNFFEAKNTPQAVDGEGVKNLILAAPSSLKRFVFVSSCGVLRKDSFPFKILNAFGVLNAKLYAEKALQQSGLPYTIIRPGRLIDGPYTSYDLNTLLKAKTDGKKAVVIGTGDTLNGETSRIDVANVCVECLNYDLTINQAFDIINSGERPPVIDWQQLFSQNRYSYPNGELIPINPPRLTREQQLERLNTHPMFTGVCPQCGHQFNLNNPPKIHWDCPACSWVDDSV